MRQGKQSIIELGAEVNRQAEAKKDYIVPARAMTMIPASGSPALQLAGQGAFTINDHAHGQLAEYFDIPGKYYDRLRSSQPDLLANTVNTLMGEHEDDRRMVRTLDGKIRAFLSDRYRALDNVDLMNAVIPFLMNRSDLEFASAEVTERRLYLKVISRELKGEVKVGDEIQAGAIIQNSEVGSGSLVIAPFSLRLSCTNGATHNALGMRKAHLGRAIVGEPGDVAAEFLSDEARQADDQAFFLKARDLLTATLSGEMLNRLLGSMREATEDKIREPEQTVEAVAVQIGLNETERTNVLRNLIEGADLSRWGMANAITRAAEDAADYDRASELERLGGDLMTTGTLPTPIPVAARRARRSYKPTMAAANAD
jgi:hypothetical protein